MKREIVRAAWMLAGAALLIACTASQRGAVADFFGGFFGAAAPVATAAGQPWLGSLLSWGSSLLLQHPYESAGAGLAAVGAANHWINGTPGTKRRERVRTVRTAKAEAARRTTAQMRVLDAETAHRREVEAAEARMRRATAKKNAALLKAQAAQAPRHPAQAASPSAPLPPS